MSIDWRMDKQNVVCAYNGIFYSHKKNLITCDNMDRHSRHHAKENKPNRRINTAWLYLYDMSKVVKFIRLKSRMAVVRCWWEAEKESCY